MQFLGDGQVVFTDAVDGSKWVFCTGCKQAYHLQCVTSCTELQLEAKGWPFTCTFNECKQVFIQAGHHLDWIYQAGQQAGHFNRTFTLQ